MESLSEFMKKELIYYIDRERRSGKELADIKMALINVGHHETLVDVVLEHLKKHDFDVVKALDEDIESPEEELYYDIVNALVKYIEYQKRNKVPFSKVKKKLLNYGHSLEDIESAIKVVRKKNQVNYQRFILPFAVISLIVFILYISASVGEPMSLVMMGLFPIFFTIIGGWIAVSYRQSKLVLWFIPIVTTVGFIAIVRINPLLFKGMSVQNLASFDLLVSFVYIYLFSMQPDVESTQEKKR